MGLGDFVPDSWEDTSEDVTRNVGEAVDSSTDFLADRFEKANAPKGMTSWLRDKGDAAASAMGASPGESELDQTDDPKKLIHGSAATLRANASHLKGFQKAFEKVASGLKGLDSQHLRGKAADAFREKVSVQPGKWHKAADACEKAANALEDFAGTVTWAQGQAEEALEKYKKAKSASDAHADKLQRYEWAADQGLNKKDLGDRPSDTDPGAAGMSEAQHILKEARRQRNEAALTARSAVSAAREAAPEKPDYGDQVDAGMDGLKLSASHLGGGVVRGTAGLVSFARGLYPLDPYNLTHPGAYLTNLNSTVAGLVRTANDPVGTGKRMWSEFKKDPWEFGGRVLPELLGSKGAGMARRGASTARRAGEQLPGRKRVNEDGPEKSCTPNQGKCSGNTDPVDLATGRMYLPQTDVTLPGALPLVFRRQVESGYDAGRWFGPSWASTVDQRLEIDAEGVVFVSEDGLLLSFPHPAAGAPTLPSHGPRRWQLDRTSEGDYVLTDPDSGHVRHFTAPVGDIDGTALIDEISDRNGNRITFEYAPDGTPLSLVHSAGYRLQVATEAGRVASLSLSGAATDGGDQVLYRYGYDSDGNLTGVLNSSGGVLEFEYDEERRVTAWVDSNARRYDYAYDDQHRCISEGSPEGYVAFHIDYDGYDETTGHRVTTLTRPGGEATRFLVNDQCKVVAQTDPLGHTVRTHFDRYGQQVAQTDALGRTVRLGRDDDGRLTSLTRADGSQVALTLNDLGLPVEVVEADGATWRHAYDAAGNRTAVTDPAGRTTSYEYDAAGRLGAVTDALGAVTRVRCDGAGLPVEITDPGGGVTSYGRDAFGRPTAVVDPVGSVTRLVWSPGGHLVRRVLPDGGEESWQYDGEGNCVSHVDAGGGITRYEYGHFDLLIAQTGPDGVRYEFAHDAELRLSQVTNPQGLTWEYTYDPAGRLVAETDFDDRTVVYELDAADQLTARTTALGETVRFERDLLGRIVRKDAAGAQTRFAYDVAGRLVSASGPDAELVYQRDKLGRIKTELVNGRALSHSYDALGRSVRRVTPSGAVSTFAYDAAGNRTAVTASGRTFAFSHDAAGRETGRRIGGAGLELSHLWDPAGRLSAQTVTGPDEGTVQHRSYRYRPDGNLVGIDDQLNGARHFDVDPAGRVTAVHARNWTETYAYDTAGNQTEATWPDRHASAEARGERAYEGTRIRRAGAVRYEHDAAGRMVLRQKSRLSKKPDTWRYTWDTEDRLTSCTTPDGTVWRYRYDPFGRRITKQRLAADGESVLEQVDFTWDGPTLVEQTTTGPQFPDPVSLTWDHNGLQPIAQTERRVDEASQREIDSRFFAIITDLIGTPTELLDEQGDIAWRTRTTLWGTTTWSTNSTAYTPLRFPGQYHDPETALHYNHHRHYDPETGRYTTPDPLGLEPAPNPMAYVHNPHTWMDPLGLAPDGCPDDKSPRTPVGRRGGQFDVSLPEGRTARNAPGEINGIEYSGHALDRMQKQGMVPSLIENTMRPENAVTGKMPGTTAYYDPENHLTVLTNSESGRVITVDFGRIRQ